MAATLALWPGCRCGSSSPAEPETSPSARPQTPLLCPPQPAWAPPPPDPELLLAELLMQPEGDSTRQGTGIRIFSDGRVFAFDEVAYDTKDGKLTSRPILGKWRQHRSVAASRVDDLRALIAREDREGLAGWQGKNRKGKGRASHLFLRSGPDELRSCYRGLDGGDNQKHAEELIKKIMGEAFSEDINRLAEPRPSASPPSPSAPPSPPASSR